MVGTSHGAAPAPRSSAARRSQSASGVDPVIMPQREFNLAMDKFDRVRTTAAADGSTPQRPVPRRTWQQISENEQAYHSSEQGITDENWLTGNDDRRGSYLSNASFLEAEALSGIQQNEMQKQEQHHGKTVPSLPVASCSSGDPSALESDIAYFQRLDTVRDSPADDQRDGDWLMRTESSPIQPLTAKGSSTTTLDLSATDMGGDHRKTDSSRANGTSVPRIPSFKLPPLRGVASLESIAVQENSSPPHAQPALAVCLSARNRSSSARGRPPMAATVPIGTPRRATPEVGGATPRSAIDGCIRQPSPIRRTAASQRSGSVSSTSRQPTNSNDTTGSAGGFASIGYTPRTANGNSAAARDGTPTRRQGTPPPGSGRRTPRLKNGDSVKGITRTNSMGTTRNAVALPPAIPRARSAVEMKPTTPRRGGSRPTTPRRSTTPTATSRNPSVPRARPPAAVLNGDRASRGSARSSVASDNQMNTLYFGAEVEAELEELATGARASFALRNFSAGYAGEATVNPPIAKPTALPGSGVGDPSISTPEFKSEPREDVDDAMQAPATNRGCRSPVDVSRTLRLNDEDDMMAGGSAQQPESSAASTTGVEVQHQQSSSSPASSSGRTPEFRESSQLGGDITGSRGTEHVSSPTFCELSTVKKPAKREVDTLNSSDRSVNREEARKLDDLIEEVAAADDRVSEPKREERATGDQPRKAADKEAASGGKCCIVM